MRKSSDHGDNGLDADLRALFADERMALPVSQDRVDSVVAGARRLRRRRTAMMASSGALGAVAVVLAGGLLAGHLMRPNTVATGTQPGRIATSGSARSATPTPGSSYLETTSAPASVPGVPAMPLVIGPNGYGELSLGMSVRQALDTHMINWKEPGYSGCAVYTYRLPPPSTSSAAAKADARAPYVWFTTSKQPAVVTAISPAPEAMTPEGIGIGSTFQAVKLNYPKAAAQGATSTLVTPVPGNPNAEYLFVMSTATRTPTVVSLYLAVAGFGCFGG